MLDFIVLGLIPGTNISLSFTAIAILFSVAGLFVVKNQHEHHKNTRQNRTKANKIAEISL